MEPLEGPIPKTLLPLLESMEEYTWWQGAFLRGITPGAEGEGGVMRDECGELVLRWPEGSMKAF